MSKIFSLEDKTAIITGGYGHLGTAMSLAMLNAGANVIVAGRSEEKFKAKFQKYSDSSIEFKQCDITETSSFKELFKYVYEKYGHIDVIVNNAHTAKGSSAGAEKMKDEDWTYTMEGVVASIHKSIREAIPYLKKQKAGKIINISSMYGVVSPDFRMYEEDDCEKYLNPPHYGAAKAAMIQLTKYYAVHLGKYNVQVNTLTPGPFPNEIIQNENPEFINRLKSRNPLNKIGKPEDIDGVLLLLSSKASDFITGQNIIIDGGWTIW